MFNAESIKQFTQANISTDKEKTSERTRALWFSIGKSQRQDILDLAGVTKYTVQRSYKEGNISAKLVAAISQTLKVNPAYLTGESDESHGFSNVGLAKYLEVKTDKKGKAAKAAKAAKTVGKGRPGRKKAVLAETAQPALEEAVAPASVVKPGRKPRKSQATTATVSTTAAAAAANTEVASADSVAALARSISSVKYDKINKISDDELSLLLNSLILKAKFNGNSEDLLKLIKYILVI